MSEPESTTEFFPGRLLTSKPSARDFEFFSTQARQMHEAAELVGDRKLAARLVLIAASLQWHGERIRRPWVQLPDPLAMSTPAAMLLDRLQEAAEVARGSDEGKLHTLLQEAIFALQSYDQGHG